VWLLSLEWVNPLTASVSVQGNYLVGSHDLAIGGGGGEPN